MTDEARAKYNAYMREYRQKNKDRINERNRALRAADPERYKRYKESYWQRKAEAGA